MVEPKPWVKYKSIEISPDLLAIKMGKVKYILLVTTVTVVAAIFVWTNSTPTRRCLSAHACQREDQMIRDGFRENGNPILQDEQRIDDFDFLMGSTRKPFIPRRHLSPGSHPIEAAISNTDNKLDRDEDSLPPAPVKEIPINERIRKKIINIDVHDNCSSIISNPSLVLNCVTGDVIGRVPPDLLTYPFEAPSGSTPETRESRAKSFKDVFDSRAWGKNWDSSYKDLSASGRGATLPWAQEAIATLHVVINQIKAKLGKTKIRILDVPCGDMAWMSRFLLSRDDIDYTGIDIVPALIKHHNQTYKRYPWKFRLQDIVETPITEQYDIILCRMTLQHLFYYDVMRVLKKMSDSQSRYLLTTTFLINDRNKEVSFSENPGRYRELNLEIPPISLSPPLCVQRDGPSNDFEGYLHFLGLWQLPLRQVLDCDYPYTMQMKNNERSLYSCSDWIL